MLIGNAEEILALCMRVFLLVILFFSLVAGATAQVADSVLIQEGVASFYGKRFHQRMTANGEIFHMDSLTAAHKYLPFDTWVKVTRKGTNDSIWVRINDRLPRTSRRIIDLSREAARELEMIDKGLAPVRLEVATIKEMNALYRYFDGDAPGTIRIRVYEKPIMSARPRPSWIWEIGKSKYY